MTLCAYDTEGGAEMSSADNTSESTTNGASGVETKPQSLIAASLRSPVVTPIVFAACLVILIIGLRYTAEIMAPLFLVITLAILFAPLLHWLERKGVPSGPAIIVLLAGLIAFFAAFFWVVYISLQQLVAKLPAYQAMLVERLAPLKDLLVPPGVEIIRFVEGNFTAASTQLEALLTFISGLASNIYYLFIYTFILFLLLAQSSKFAERFRQANASNGVFARQFTRYAAQIQRQYTTQTFSNFISALTILGILLVFGVDFAYLWAFLAFFLGYIPMIGLLIACVPAVFLAFIQYGLGTALLVLLLIILLNAAMDNFVTPHFMGDRLHLPTVFIMIGFLFWGWVYGPFGALLAVPLTLLVRVLLESSQATRFHAGLMTSVDEPAARETPVAQSPVSTVPSTQLPEAVSDSSS
jgi:predicted PurR-regulated permease PerM